MYAELHCLSNFTFLRGASHPAELVLRAKELNYAALAITDECSMAGAVRAFEAAQDCKFKLIVGSEFRTVDDLHIVLLAPSQKAYAQICALITKGRITSDKGTYRLTRNDFDNSLSECLALWIPPKEFTLSQALWLRERFPDRCWIAVELHRQSDDVQRLKALQQLGAESHLPLVAAGDVHMHIRERRLLQDTVTAIRHRCTIAEAGHRLYPNGERHLRSYDELSALYPSELLAETNRIAELCNFSLGSLKYNYPHELVPAGLNASEHLRQLVQKGMQKRWPHGTSWRLRRKIIEELKLIKKLQYEHFFLTVYDIVCYARANQILCQGRGSAANSVVCYALEITAVDPNKIGLLFGRFLSEERHEPPDIDVDFEHQRREEVIQYIFTKYGAQRAAIAATVITYRTRSAIRDVGKALGFALDTVDQLAKMQAFWDDWKAFREHLQAHGMQLDAEAIQRFCFLVKEIRGFPRHLSQHVGGFVIADEPISQLVPIEKAAMEGRQIIQWDKNDLETLGLLKVDVLALGMLSALRRSFDMLQVIPNAPKRMEEVPDDDTQTYDMICAADTVGVFQIESRAQMSMLPRLRPRNYYDLVIEVAIVRPGPIQGGMVHPYLKRRLNKDAVTYPSEALKKVLQRTLGVPIFQEQVMEIAIVAAGFTPGEADQLRRSMAAWQRSGNMEKFRTKLINGMLERNYTREFAEQIFKQIEGFAEYGFPESHSASFALLTYCSCYLKRHYPAAFFAALINSQPMGFYSPRQLLETAKRQGVPVLPIDAQVSEWDCTLEKVESHYAIRIGLRQVRNLRETEAQAIAIARSQKSFISTADLAHRAHLTSRAMKALALAGALRSFASHRHAAVWNALGVERLPGLMAGLSAQEVEPTLPAPTEWEDILTDYRQIGLSTGRHPLALLRSTLQSRGVSARVELERLRDGQQVKVCGLVTHLQHPETAHGVVFASLEDEGGINNVIIWPNVFDAYRYVLLSATLIAITGKLQTQDHVINVVAEKIEDYSHLTSGLDRNSRDFR